MNDAAPLTAEQFAEQKNDLPDGGRWVELRAGRVVTLDPPDVLHGNVVLNFSKQLAQSLQAADDPGYACFELGLIVGRNPDTVCVPQVSYFERGERFAATDAAITKVPPTLVVEVASTNDRRRDIAFRVREYLKWGVESVWIIDPGGRQCFVHAANRPAEQLARHDDLSGGKILPKFRIQVEALFADPKWWNG